MAKENRLTLFVATDSDLDACFPGWRLPLPEPRSVQTINPFTREPATFKTYDPGRPPEASPPRSIRPARRRKVIDAILSPEGEEARWLEEEDTPALLKTFPHFAMWGVSVWPWRELLTLLGLPFSPPSDYGTLSDVPECVRPARIVDCLDEEGMIVALPEGVAGPLAALDDRATKKCLADWQKALGIRGKAVKRIETEFAEGSAWALRRIRALAAEADRLGGNIFISSRT